MADLYQGKSINSILSIFAEVIQIRLVVKNIRVVLFMNSRGLGLFELSLIPSCSFLCCANSENSLLNVYLFSYIHPVYLVATPV